jgi:hypothetical protein
MTTKSNVLSAPDLTKRAPRSTRCRLGGFALLPRLLDKCRALLAGTIGDYHSNCPLDQIFLAYAGIDYAQLRAELAQGRTDGEILTWIVANSKTRRTGAEIEIWSAYQDRRLPDSDGETAGYFATMLSGITKTRPDIHTWADLLDLDDHVSFGGTA